MNSIPTNVQRHVGLQITKTGNFVDFVLILAIVLHT